jgi:hypothetical protein
VNQGNTREVDVVIVTAIRLEFDAVLQVDADASPGSTWEDGRGPSGLPVAFRSFVVPNRRALRVAVAVAPDPVARFCNEPWFRTRPITMEWREHQALVALRDAVPEPWNAVGPELEGDAWKGIVEGLCERGLLAPSGRALTDAGLRLVEELLFKYQNALPDLSPTGTLHPFRLHVAPIGRRAKGRKRISVTIAKK